MIPESCENINLKTNAVTVTGSIQLMTTSPRIVFESLKSFAKNIANRKPSTNWITRHPIVYINVCAIAAINVLSAKIFL